MKSAEKLQPLAILMGLAVLVNICRNFLWLLPSALMSTIMTDASLSYAQMGHMSLVVSVLMGFFLIGGSYILEPIGPSVALCIGTVALAVDGFCSSIGNNYTVLILGKVFCGIGYGLTTCSITALIAQTFPKERLGLGNSMNACISSLSVALAYRVIVPVYQRIGSWKIEAGALAVLSMATAIVIFLWDRGLRRPASKKTQKNNLLEALRYPVVHKFIAIYGSLNLLYISLSSYFPNYLSQVAGYSLEEASSLAGMISLAGIAGSMSMGLIADRGKKRKPVILLLVALAFAGFCGMMSLRVKWALICAILCYGGSYFALNAFCITSVMRINGITVFISSAAVSLMAAFGNQLALFIPNLQQILADNMGLQFAVASLGVLFLPAGIGGILLPRHFSESH